MLRPLSFIVICACLLAPLAHAQSTEERRRNLSESYLDNSRNNPSIFIGAPINHIVPAFNTITYALELQKNDVIIEPEGDDGFGRSEKLKVGGYKVSPYIALSLKHVGIGFSIEGGRKTVEFSQGNAAATLYTPPNNLSLLENNSDAIATTDHEQISTLNYRAVGVYMYLIPFPKLKEKKITLTLILGARNYSCTHEIGAYKSLVDGNENPTESKVYPYTVTAYESGLNMIYKLAKNVDIIPWGQYYYADTRTIELFTDQTPDYELTKYLDDDVQIMWHDRPQFQYGIDLALKIQRFEVRLGGVIGALVSYGQVGTNKSIHDRSVSLAFAYDMKGS